MTSTQPALRDASAITDEDGDAERDLNVVLAWTVGRFKEIVLADVDRVRRRHPELENEELARIVVRRGVRRVGWASFATGFGGAPLIAANVSSVIALQAAIVLAVAEVYGELDSPDIKRDIALMIGGDSAVQTFKQFGVVATNDFSKRWVQRNVTRETMKQVHKVVSRKVITKAGEKSITSFTKLVPVVGAGVGYVIDRSYARLLGERAIRYYAGR